jgi:hypothetical protein
MENIPTIHLHIPHMISLWTSIHGKCRDIGKKNSNNKKASYKSHIYFISSRERTPLELLNLQGGRL